MTDKNYLIFTITSGNSSPFIQGGIELQKLGML